MKIIFLHLLMLLMFVQCKKESDDCHFFITINNNSSEEIIFGIKSFSKGLINCQILESDKVSSNYNYKYRPYPHPDCIENAIKVDDEKLLYPLYIIDSNNYTTEAVPCEEFEERNTILRTYILTLEDLERLDYTINYPEVASIGVE